MHRSSLPGLLGGLLAVVSAAQSAPVVTEAEFLSVLDNVHPAVRESALALAVAEASVLAARTFNNPVLDVVREDPGGPIGQTDVLVSWQIPGPGRGRKIEVRKGAVEAARRSFAHQMFVHRLSMREAYADWAVAAVRQNRLAAQAERVESLARREAARAERGEASGLEAGRLRLAAATLRSRVILAAAGEEQARAEAAAWYPNLPADARPVLPVLPEAPSLDGDDLRLEIAEADLAAAELAELAIRPIVASPEVRLGWQEQDTGLGSASGPVFGVVWSIPLFDRRQAARRSSTAALKAARARLELVDRESTSSRRSAKANFTRLVAVLDEVRQELETTERMLDGAEAAFRQGEASLTDLLDTHRSVIEAELAALDLHEAALAAHRQLERFAAARQGGP